MVGCKNTVMRFEGSLHIIFRGTRFPFFPESSLHKTQAPPCFAEKIPNASVKLSKSTWDEIEFLRSRTEQVAFGLTFDFWCLTRHLCGWNDWNPSPQLVPCLKSLALA